MFRIDTPDATQDNRFTEGDPTIPVEATTVSADWLNSVQEELIAILEHAKITPDKASTTQVCEAVTKMIERRIPIASPDTMGIVRPDGQTLYIDTNGVLSVVPTMAEFKDFFEQTPPPGWAVRDGSILTGADTKYPKLWEHLNTEKNLWKCKSIADWEALSVAANGVGGVPFFVVDGATKTIKLPDTRTDHSFGLPASDVGKWEGDAIRNLTGVTGGYFDFVNVNGVFSKSNLALGVQSVNGAASGYHNLNFSAANVTPTASQVRPRRFALLPCVYVGGNN